MTELAEQQTSTDPSSPGGTALSSEVPTVVIRPRKGWFDINWAELWHYRELFFFLVWRDFKARYKQTVLGATWAIIRPLMAMVVFSLVFGKFAGMPSRDVPYPVFVYSGLLAWQLFADALNAASISLVAQAGLLTKVYFPRLMMPAANAGIALADHLLALLIYVLILAYFNLVEGAAVLPGASVALIPVLTLLTIITALGCGTFLAALTVCYRDFRSITPFLIQTWMYLSPVVYPVKLVPEAYRWVLALNPLAGIIDAYRSCWLNQPIDWTTLGVSSAISIFMLVFGVGYFRHMERRFADVA